MVREIIHDPIFLRRKSLAATSADLPIAEDLVDTLRANADRCVGLAANMIGKRKRIIAFCNGPLIMVMLNPQIINKDGEYETEEGCLSLEGVRKALYLIEYLWMHGTAPKDFPAALPEQA